MKGVFERNNLKISAKKVKGFYAFAPTFHSHMEILYVISGNINVSIDGVAKKGYFCEIIGQTKKN